LVHPFKVYANVHPFNQWTGDAPISGVYHKQGDIGKAQEYFRKAEESKKKGAGED
jgi:hypothetical protein